jgi:alkylation response protein AidB-like acyl-CoA dehydrogenase
MGTPMSLFDQGISEEKRKSLEFAEEAREQEWKYPSFALKIFHGQIDWPLIHPFPKQSDADKKIGDEYLKKLSSVLKDTLDPDQVDQTGLIPDKTLKSLADIGAFAMKIPQNYGGQGLSQVNYNRAIHLVASYCGSTAVLLSAHQSIGVPQPLKLFGTEDQRRKYLPLFAKGTISAFALTEPEAGSDPRTMKTTATPTTDGKYFLINGEKLWCTNGPVAGVLVVMAVTPPKIVKGKERKQITAFIVETNTPGFEVVHRCRFMGLNGIQNGLLRFSDVKVPKENIILGEGEGLRLALMTLNTGRLTIPAAATGVSKWCLNVARRWAKQRVQWGSPIGEHESIALKLADMASHTFAMEAVCWLSSAMADDHNRDIRIEAAMAKYFCTIHNWRIVDETLQIRGGQGYEKASSLKARGMPAWPVERVLRDIRINLIIEGTSEIMHLFIAREALDPHLSRVTPLLSARTPFKAKLQSLGKMIKFYACWYPGLWLPNLSHLQFEKFSPLLKKHMRYAQGTTRRLARHLFHQMIIHRQGLEAKQATLNRIVDIGTDLFAMTAVGTYAHSLRESQHPSATQNDILELADLFCQQATMRIEKNFRDHHRNTDGMSYRIAQRILREEYRWLESDIVTDTF